MAAITRSGPWASGLGRCRRRRGPAGRPVAI